MHHDLTEQQRALATWIFQHVGKDLTETFFVLWSRENPTLRDSNVATFVSTKGTEKTYEVDRGTIEVLGAEGLLRIVDDSDVPHRRGKFASAAAIYLRRGIRCTVTGKLAKAVRSNFASEPFPTAINTPTAQYPPEIAISIDRLRRKFPDPNTLGFLVMRFAAAKPFSRIVEVIKKTGEEHGLTLIRADENEFHADLWGNVRTHLHGCSFGVAVYERIETDEPNANVGLEVGYLMAMNKPVLLLKDRTVETLPADLAGKLYKTFDPHDPENSIPERMTKWLHDNGIVVPRAETDAPKV
jgi:hypothetical protein